jgi:hypothetical protein
MFREDIISEKKIIVWGCDRESYFNGIVGIFGYRQR